MEPPFSVLTTAPMTYLYGITLADEPCSTTKVTNVSDSPEHRGVKIVFDSLFSDIPAFSDIPSVTVSPSHPSQR